MYMHSSRSLIDIINRSMSKNTPSDLQNSEYNDAFDMGMVVIMKQHSGRLCIVAHIQSALCSYCQDQSPWQEG